MLVILRCHDLCKFVMVIKLSQNPYRTHYTFLTFISSTTFGLVDSASSGADTDTSFITRSGPLYTYLVRYLIACTEQISTLMWHWNLNLVVIVFLNVIGLPIWNELTLVTGMGCMEQPNDCPPRMWCRSDWPCALCHHLYVCTCSSRRSAQWRRWTVWGNQSDTP